VGIQEKARALIELTVCEIRRLLCRLLVHRRPPRWEEVLWWSVWRRHHQAVAKRCHYKRRGVLLAWITTVVLVHCSSDEFSDHSSGLVRYFERRELAHPFQTVHRVPRMLSSE